MQVTGRHVAPVRPRGGAARQPLGERRRFRRRLIHGRYGRPSTASSPRDSSATVACAARNSLPPGRGHRVVPAGAAAALVERLAQTRSDEALGLQPIERGEERAARDAPAGSRGQRLAHGYRVGGVAALEHGQQDQMFELAEVGEPEAWTAL